MIEQVRCALTEERARGAASGEQHELGFVCRADADLCGERGRKTAAEALQDGLLVPEPFKQGGQRGFGREYLSQRSHVDRTWLEWCEFRQERRELN